MSFELMSSCASHVHDIVIDPIIILDLLLFFNSLFQELFHLFNAIMRLVFVNLIHFDFNTAFFANFNSLRANFEVLFDLFFVELGATPKLAEMASILAVFLMLDGFCVRIPDKSRGRVFEFRAILHRTIESELHQDVVDELVDLDVLCIGTLERAVPFLLLPFLNASFAEQSLALAAFFGVQNNLCTDQALEVFMLTLETTV